MLSIRPESRNELVVLKIHVGNFNSGIEVYRTHDLKFSFYCNLYKQCTTVLLGDNKE